MHATQQLTGPGDRASGQRKLWVVINRLLHQSKNKSHESLRCSAGGVKGDDPLIKMTSGGKMTPSIIMMFEESLCYFFFHFKNRFLIFLEESLFPHFLYLLLLFVNFSRWHFADASPIGSCYVEMSRRQLYPRADDKSLRGHESFITKTSNYL